MNLQDKVNEVLGSAQPQGKNSLEKQAEAHSAAMSASGWQESPSEPIEQVPSTHYSNQPEPTNEQRAATHYVNQPEQVADNLSTPEPEPVEPMTKRSELDETRIENEIQRRENLKNLREMKERLQWERDEAVRLLEQERAYKQQQKQQAEDADDSGIEDEDLTAKKHVKKIVSQSVNKSNRALEEKLNRLETQLIERELSDEFPNFKNIVTDANLKKLAERYPHHVRNLSYSPNYKDRAAGAYDLIKQYGIDEEATKERDGDMVKQKIATNLARPKSSATVSPNTNSSSLAKQSDFSGELTETRKAQIWREMQEIKKRNPVMF